MVDTGTLESAKDPKKVTKKWEERPGDIAAFPVYSDGSEGWSDYHLVRSSNNKLCILHQGDVRDTDIGSSFYGTPEPYHDDDEETGP